MLPRLIAVIDIATIVFYCTDVSILVVIRLQVPELCPHQDLTSFGIVRLASVKFACSEAVC